VTRLQAVGVMLIALGLVYGVLYAAWLRKQRRHGSASIATDDRAASGRADVVAEGTYISTTTAQSRLERVTVEGLGNRARATLTVRRGDADQLVRIERQGESTVVIPAARLVAARRDGGMAGKWVGAKRVVVLQWRAEDGAVYETGFLPRHRADIDRIESALWWHTGDPTATQGEASS
jgi:hypothetical protein